MALWFSSDFHFCHGRDFVLRDRGFQSIEEMNSEILRRWNEKVSPEDDGYILGDLMLLDNEKGIEYIEKLNGKLHIVLGNHDTDTKIEAYRKLKNIVEVCYATTIRWNKQTFFLCHFPVVCNHPAYPKPFGSSIINLFGHTHQKENFWDNNPYMYHVGVDSHNCYPCLIDNIYEECRKKYNEINNLIAPFPKPSN